MDHDTQKCGDMPIGIRIFDPSIQAASDHALFTLKSLVSGVFHGCAIITTKIVNKPDLSGMKERGLFVE